MSEHEPAQNGAPDEAPANVEKALPGPAHAEPVAEPAPADVEKGSYKAGGEDTKSPLDEDSIDEEDREAIQSLLDGKRQKSKTMNLLTEEEKQSLSKADQAALIQKRLREKRLERERKEALMAEKHRIESAKLMAETRRQLEEAERKRAFEHHLKEREEKKQAEERQKELLRQDFRERFGRDMNEEELQRQTIGKMSNREKVVYFIGKLRSRLKGEEEEAQKGRIITCAKTLRVYCVNLKDNPGQKKFYSIKTSNKAFQERVAPFPEAVEILKAVGFVEMPGEDGSPVLQVQTVLPDGFTLGEAIKFLNFIVGA